jgi:hypothetical protein
MVGDANAGATGGARPAVRPVACSARRLGTADSDAAAGGLTSRAEASAEHRARAGAFAAAAADHDLRIAAQCIAADSGTAPGPASCDRRSGTIGGSRATALESAARADHASRGVWASGGRASCPGRPRAAIAVVTGCICGSRLLRIR